MNPRDNKDEPYQGEFYYPPSFLKLLGWDCSPTQAALTPDFLDARTKYSKPLGEMETQDNPMTANVTYATALIRIPIHISFRLARR